MFAAVVLGIYGSGYARLSESAANRFLDELETLSLQGHGAEYCARLHEDIKVSIKDFTAATPAIIAGGKRELCDFVSYAAQGVSLLGITSHVHRDNFVISRSWLHPWTAQVSYHERRTTNMSKVHQTLNTVSDDRLTLVQTFSGVKLLRLESTARRAQ
jgi:hypothetical protein